MKPPSTGTVSHFQRVTALGLLCCLSVQAGGCATSGYHPTPAASPLPQAQAPVYKVPQTAEDFMQLPPRKAPVKLDERFVTNNAFRCDREFIYNGKKLNCDSNAKPDGEGLRAVVQDTPSAVNELDTYQDNRRSIRNAAYVGSVGLLSALAGLLISRQFTDSAGNISSTGSSIRNIMGIGGFSLFGGSLIYALTVVKTNESHLGAAVQNFNTAHPDHPIELQFSTGLSF